MSWQVRQPIVFTSDSDVSVAGFAVATGWAHETPRLRGVTDRAMQWLAATPGVSGQWQVDALVSFFWVTGSPRAVQIGLADVLRQARRNPVPSPLMETTPNPDLDAVLLQWRWGLRGFGLQRWSRLAFVSAEAGEIAAVLSRIGPRNLQLFAVNAEIDASAVPDVDDAPIPTPDFPPLIPLPALLEVTSGFAMGWHVPRHDAVAEGLVRMAVAEATRTPADAGPAHGSWESTPHWLSRHLGSQGSHTSVIVPAGLSDEATAQLADRLRDWSAYGPDQRDLDRAVSIAHDARPRSPWDLMRGAVEDSLLGSGDETWDLPTADGARQGLVRILDSMLVLAPITPAANRLADHWRAPAPEPLAGDTYRSVRLIRRGRKGVVVTAGADGVAVRDPEHLIVIRSPDVAAVERWPDGQLLVTSMSGQHQLFLDPAELTGGNRMSAQVRALAPEAVVEHPQACAVSPLLFKAYRVAGGWALTAVVLLIPAVLLAVLLLLGALAGTGSVGDRVAMAAVGLVFAALAGLAAIRVVRLRRVGRAVKLGPWGRSEAEVRRGRGARA